MHNIAVDLKNRDIRQRDIVPPDKLADVRATVIGVGAVGRQVALQLTAMGVPQLELVDFDDVGVENLACQGYWHGDLGDRKVDATAALCRHINPDVVLQARYSRFRKSDKVGNCVFCCVDSIQTREWIWSGVESQVDFFVDGRMSAEVIRVVTASDPVSKVSYQGTLFASNEAHVGSCTAKSTIFTGNICAGLMLSSFSKHLRGFPIDEDVCLNLLTNEMTVGVEQLAG